MRCIIKSSIASVVLLLFSHLTGGQYNSRQQYLSQPSQVTDLSEDSSLEDTQRWLKEQILNYARYKIKLGLPNQSNYSAYKVEAISFEGCRVSYKDIIVDTSLSGKVLSTHTSVYKFNLDDLDYSRMMIDRAAVIDFGNYTVNAYTLGNRSLIEHKYEFHSGRLSKRDVRPKSQVSLVFTNEDKARKVIWALSHAIKLCQIKKAQVIGVE